MDNGLKGTYKTVQVGDSVMYCGKEHKVIKRTPQFVVVEDVRKPADDHSTYYQSRISVHGLRFWDAECARQLAEVEEKMRALREEKYAIWATMDNCR